MNYPFQRKQLDNNSDFRKRFLNEIMEILKMLAVNTSELMPCTDAEISLTENLVKMVSDIFTERWALKDNMSETAFKGILIVLEYCLGHESASSDSFAHLITALAKCNAGSFWIQAIPYVCESDLRYGMFYRDGLLFNLTFYDANNGKNCLNELFTAIPGLRESLLGRCAKKFEELFYEILQRRQILSIMNHYQLPVMSPFSKRFQIDTFYDARSESELETDNESDDENEAETKNVDAEISEKKDDAKIDDHDEESENGDKEEDDESEDAEYVNEDKQSEQSVRQSSAANVAKEGSVSKNSSSDSWSFSATASVLSTASKRNGQNPNHLQKKSTKANPFRERVIAVSNAPPVSLKKDKASGKWKIGQGSGGLVTCCEPVMNKDLSNMWLACFGPGVPLTPVGWVEENDPEAVAPNSLGLPPVRIGKCKIYSKMLHDGEKDAKTVVENVKDQMSLLDVLQKFNCKNYKLKPIVVPDHDYNSYYGGISNGLLWPIFHDLTEYVATDYNNPSVLQEHWHAYVKVNYLFALNTVRYSRPQDFLWIHDYHLLLTGLIVQSLDPNLKLGFFLHIPFQPPADFFTKFKVVADAVLRSLLKFTKVGFQTNRDRQIFVEYVQFHFPSAVVRYNQHIDKHFVAYEGSTTSLGVFPVSIKNEDFLDIARKESVQKEARQIREKLMKARKGALFFSVERFDYTKGIKEKLLAYLKYFVRFPERIGKDVFFQVAVTNRRSVDTYRQYQDECLKLVEKLNNEVKSKTDVDWKALIFQTDGLKRPNLVAHYLAMDVGVVTPRKDGMNLVAKEMIICNVNASLVLSCGAGTEQQFNHAGFYKDPNKCYHRVVDIFNADDFAQNLFNAAVEDKRQVKGHSMKLHKYLMVNNIEKWSQTFLDPSWISEPKPYIELDELE